MTQKQRAVAALLLSFVALVVLIASTVLYSSEMHEPVRAIAFGVALLAVMCIVFIAKLLQNELSTRELVDMARDAMENDSRVTEAWNVGVQSPWDFDRPLSFQELPILRKTLVVGIILFGSAVVIYGILDIAGMPWIKEYTMRRFNGESVLVPRWATGLFEILFGVGAFLMHTIAMYGRADPFEGALKQFMKEMNIRVKRNRRAS